MTRIGLNVPWFGGAYGHDLGRNRAYPDWPVWYDAGGVEGTLDRIRAAGVQLLRIWLFEEGEGIAGDGAMRADDMFLRNLAHLSGLLSGRGFEVYWTLFDANSARGKWDRITAPILTSAETAAEFCSGILAGVAPIVGGTAWAIDLCNEPEAIVAGRSGNGTDWGWRWKDVYPSLGILRDAVRALLPGIPVSVGSGYHNGENVLAGRYDGLGLDFLDYHSYTETPPAPPGKAVTLGEIGCAPGMVPADLGYHAAFAWDYAALPDFGKPAQNL
jgi:hypothetical protein